MQEIESASSASLLRAVRLALERADQDHARVIEVDAAGGHPGATPELESRPTEGRLGLDSLTLHGQETA